MLPPTLQQHPSGFSPASNTTPDLQLLANTYQTPFYVYDVRELCRQCSEFQTTFSQSWFQLYFATMANDQKVILEQLASLGLGACVNSIAHLNLALESGFASNKIQFSSTGLSKKDMEQLLSLDIQLNIDSLQQLEQWITVGGSRLGLRVNASSLSADRPEDRIGMSLSDLNKAQSIARSRGLSIAGLHVYIGTNLQSHEHLTLAVNRLFEVSEKFGNIKYLNIGGGIGVNYQHSGEDFDLAAYSHAISECYERLNCRIGRRINVIIEPGRRLAASCGKMVTRVTDVKHLHSRRYAAVDASIAIFPRPFHNPEWPHYVRHFSNKNTQDGAPQSEAVIVGKTTFSKDILGTATLPDSLNVDDVLVFEDAGSYCQSMETKFLGQSSPGVLIIDETGNVICHQ